MVKFENLDKFWNSWILELTVNGC